MRRGWSAKAFCGNACSTGQTHPKLRERLHSDLFNPAVFENELSGFDACFFCLGVSSAGMTEERYRRVTYDIPIGVATLLASRNPGMTFIYVSGMGTDSSERGRSMWARVKGHTENALLRLPFTGCYMFRPGVIVPLHGIRSRTKLYRVIYSVMGPLLPLLNARFPKYVTTTEQVGLAMIKVAKQGSPKAILETSDINGV